MELFTINERLKNKKDRRVYKYYRVSSNTFNRIVKSPESIISFTAIPPYYNSVFYKLRKGRKIVSNRKSANLSSDEIQNEDEVAIGSFGDQPSIVHTKLSFIKIISIFTNHEKIYTAKN